MPRNAGLFLFLILTSPGLAQTELPGKKAVSLKSEKFPWSLVAAVAHGKTNLVSLLLRMGADVNEVSPEGNRPLDLSCLKGDAHMTRFLLENGADPKLRNTAGSTPLHDAALSGNKETIELLVARGADVNAIDSESGSTPLHKAASFGRLDAVKVLVQHGADVSRKTNQGFTALQLAGNNNQADVAAFLRTVTSAK